MTTFMANKFLLPLAQILLLAAITYEITPKTVNKGPLNTYGAGNLAILFLKREETRTRKNPRKSNQKVQPTMVPVLQLKANEGPEQKRKQENQRTGLRGLTAKDYDRAMKYHKPRRNTIRSRERLWLRRRATVDDRLPNHNRPCTKADRRGMLEDKEGEDGGDGERDSCQFCHVKGNSDGRLFHGSKNSPLMNQKDGDYPPKFREQRGVLSDKKFSNEQSFKPKPIGQPELTMVEETINGDVQLNKNNEPSTMAEETISDVGPTNQEYLSSYGTNEEVVKRKIKPDMVAYLTKYPEV